MYDAGIHVVQIFEASRDIQHLMRLRFILSRQLNSIAYQRHSIGLDRPFQILSKITFFHPGREDAKI